MTNALTPELYWTVLTAGLASVLWIPYILQRILQLGPIEAFCKRRFPPIAAGM